MPVRLPRILPDCPFGIMVYWGMPASSHPGGNQLHGKYCCPPQEGVCNYLGSITRFPWGKLSNSLGGIVSFLRRKEGNCLGRIACFLRRKRSTGLRGLARDNLLSSRLLQQNEKPTSISCHMFTLSYKCKLACY